MPRTNSLSMTVSSFYKSSLRVVTLTLIAVLGLVKAGCDYSVVEAPTGGHALKISITPQTAEISKGTTLSLSAIVTGFKSNGDVTWEFSGPATGELTGSGLTATYTAPAVLTSSPMMVMIRARSVEDTSRYSQAVITVLDTNAGGGDSTQIAITLTPLSVTISPGQTQQFSATVTGTTNMGVTWGLVSGPGSISSTGLYTAPAAVTGVETAVIEAASVANSNKTIRATVTIRKPVDPNLVCFERDVMPIFANNCAMSGCHSGSNPAHDDNFTTYAGIRASFDLNDDIADNDILEAITEDDPRERMPLNMPALSDAQISTIRKWIEQGAKNENCEDTTGSDCDTLNMSFAKNIQPIFANTCVGCHSGPTPSKGINLANHAGVLTVAQNGQLMGAITHASGFSSMPMYGNKLDDCTIDKIKAWINQGAPNN